MKPWIAYRLLEAANKCTNSTVIYHRFDDWVFSVADRMVLMDGAWDIVESTGTQLGRDLSGKVVEI